MARRAVLGGGSLNPFGGAGVDFGAFDVTNNDRESSLILTRVEVAWNAGQATDDQYLAALQAYAGTITANTSQRLDADARVVTMRHRVERGVLVKKVDDGSKQITDLLDYDRGALTGLQHDSEEYRQRLNTYQATQSSYYQDIEHDVVQAYNDGHMTTAQLNSWYAARHTDPTLADNPDIRKAVDDRLHDLGTRLTQERDTNAIDAYSKGKMAPATFMAYATSARARYVQGSTDYKDWTDRLNDAHDRSLETALLYRYDLSQQYAQLAKFVASSKAPTGSKGGTRTSKSTRTILGSDGQWHTVTTSKTTATPGHGPSKSELAAYAQRQIEVNDAKRQMAEIAKKIGGVGGFVSTDTTIGYYKRQLGKFAKGSDEWYQVQGKLDQLNDRKHAETVLAKEGIRISYPKGSGQSSGGTSSGSSGPKAAGGGAGGSSARAAAPSDTAHVSIDAFMTAIAHVESGGRYTARNKSSGAYGKYQMMPANWPGWAQKYLGNASAPQTPENQEKVARAKFTDLYKWLGDWRAVAHWWLTGGSNKDTHNNPNAWSSSSTKYVNNVMAGLGLGPVSGSSLKVQSTGPAGGTRAPGASSKPAAKPKPGKPIMSGRDEGPLRVIVGEGRPSPKGGGGQPLTKNTGFPKNMDGEAFKKFYAQYQAAFVSGATEFSVNSGSGTTHYFIGDDVLERRDGMRELDQLRINLFRERAHSYAGTPTEITAANQYDGAVEDAAKHELMILDTYEQKGTSTGPAESNASPIGSGIAMLEKTVAAIADHIAAADAAMKRGDLTTAYSHYQLAADLRAGKDEMIARFSAAGQNAVLAVERAYGVKRTEALGADANKQLQTDLDRLGQFGTELETALAKGSENLTLLQNIVRKDADGNPVFDQRGPGGQLMLSPGWHFELKPNGQVEPVKTPASGYDPATGKQTHDIEGKVRVDYLSGNSTVTAYVDYKTGPVGYVLASDGVTRVPIEGKTFTRRRDDGTDELWVEDPFHPGKWSSTQVAYRAPAGFKAVPGPNGATVFEFSGLTDSGRGNGAMTADGYTYHMSFDPKTGTYVMFRSKPGGLFSQEVVDEPLGSLTDGSFALNAFTTAGFGRDLSGLTGDDLTFSNMGSPFVGGSAAQYKSWRDHFQSPFTLGPIQTDVEAQTERWKAASHADAARMQQANVANATASRYQAASLADAARLRQTVTGPNAIYDQPSTVAAPLNLPALKPLPKGAIKTPADATAERFKASSAASAARTRDANVAKAAADRARAASAADAARQKSAAKAAADRAAAASAADAARRAAAARVIPRQQGR